MQSDVPLYFVERDDDKGTLVTPMEPVRVNSNDVGDLFAKIVIPEQDFQSFFEFSEVLPHKSQVVYLANLMISCIDNVCLHEYEEAILESDRYAELTLRYLAERIGLPPETSGNEVLYTRGKRNRPGLVNDLATHPGFTGDHRISRWREIR